MFFVAPAANTFRKAKNVRLRQSYKRLRLQGGTGHNGWLFGNGMSSGQVIEFEDVVRAAEEYLLRALA